MTSSVRTGGGMEALTAGEWSPGQRRLLKGLAVLLAAFAFAIAALTAASVERCAAEIVAATA